MPDFPKFGDLFRIARDEVLSLNAALALTAVDRAGSDLNVLTALAAAVGDEVVNQLAVAAAGVFLDSARGAALDRLAFDRYSLTRKPASAAVASVDFSTTAPAPAAFSIPQGTILSTSDGTQFQTQADVLYPAGSTGRSPDLPVNVGVQSLLAGAGQQAKAGTIASIVSPIVGQPADLACANEFATAGGDDEEGDDSLRDRCRRFFTTVKKGTLAAIEEGALSVPGVRTASAIDVLDELGRPARAVLLTISDAFTDAYADLVAVPASYQVQSQQLTVVVFAALADFRAGGINVSVVVGRVALQPIRLALTFVAGADVDLSAQMARAAAVNYVNGLEPGAPLLIGTIGGPGVDPSGLLGAIAAVPGLQLTGREVVSPAGDVVATPLQVLRTSLGLVTSASTQADRPLIVGTNPDNYVRG